MKTIIFDFGGTLDTNGRHWYYIFEEAYKHVGLTVEDSELRAAYVEAEQKLESIPYILPNDDFKTMLTKKLFLQLTALEDKKLLSFVGEEKMQYMSKIAAYADQLVLDNLQHVRPILSRLKQHYNLMVVSNFYGNLMAVLKAYQLPFFSQIVESATVDIRKPDPAIFQLAIDSVESKPSEITVIGDSYKNDILPAKQLGCNTIWLKGRAWKPIEENGEAADAIISDFSEIVGLLL